MSRVAVKLDLRATPELASDVHPAFTVDQLEPFTGSQGVPAQESPPHETSGDPPTVDSQPRQMRSQHRLERSSARGLGRSVKIGGRGLCIDFLSLCDKFLD